MWGSCIRPIEKGNRTDEGEGEVQADEIPILAQIVLVENVEKRICKRLIKDTKVIYRAWILKQKVLEKNN